MPSPKLDGGLEMLDRNDAPLRDVVDHAAKVLGVDLDKIPEPSRQPLDEASVSAYTFKEQWVLRWLTRRIASALEPGKNAKPGVPKADDLLDATPWRLVWHLLSVIPDDIQSEILIERKFLASLSSCVGLYLDRVSILPRSTSDQTDGAAVERLPKRRRLSPSPGLTIDIQRDLEAELLRVCSRCASLVSSAGNQHDQVRASFWSSVEDCASMLVSSLRLVLRMMLSTQNEDQSAPTHLISLLRFWAGRPVTTSESARANETMVFSQTCLGICLELLSALDETYTTPTGSLKEASQTLERLLATTVVVPLRERFVKKHLKDWRIQRPCLTWSVIQPVYRDFMVSFGAKMPDRDAKAITMMNFNWKDQAHRLYGIATRLLPKYDLRRKQQEQDWLDALLLVLGYTSCPRLTQLTLTPSGIIEPIDAAYAPESTNSVVGIEQLARLTSFSHCSPSVEAVSYVAAAILPWQELNTPWSALACLLAVYNNVLLPNTGVPTSTFALSEFAARVEHSTLTWNQYEVLKNGIILPMLRAFSQSRALKDCTLLWRDNLQEAMRVGKSSAECSEDIAAVQVWQDEDLFDEFTRQAALSTDSSLTEDLLADLQPAMAELATRSGSTLDTFAVIAIVSASIRAKGRARSPSETMMWSKLVDSAVSALGRRSDYQGQRWRLWRLINSIQRATADLVLPGSLLGDNIEQAGTVSLAQLQGDPAGVRSNQWYQECIELFTVVADEAIRQNGPFVSAFDTSIDQLQAAIVTLASSGDISNSQSLWNGQSLSIYDDWQLLAACIGVLLARPGILTTKLDFSEALLRALLSSTSQGAELQDSEDPADSLQGLLTTVLDTGSAKTAKVLRRCITQALAKDTTIITSDPRQQHIIESFLLPGLSATSLRNIGNTLYEQLRDPSLKSKQSGELARHLAIMDYISDQHSVAFTKPEALKEWVTIGERLAKTRPWTDCHSFFAICRCLQNMIRKSWAGVLEKYSTQEYQVTEIVNEALAAVMTMKPSKSKAHLPKELGRLYLTDIISRDADASRSARIETNKELQSAFDALLASDLRALISSGLDDTTYPQMAVLLDTITGANKMSFAGDELRSAVDDLNNNTLQEKGAQESKSTTLRDLISVQCVTLLSHLGRSDRPNSVEYMLKELFPTPLPTNTVTQRQLIEMATEAEAFVKSLTPEHRVICLDLMSQSSVSMQLGVLRPLIIAAIALQATVQDLEEHPEMQSRLAAIGCMNGLGSEFELDMLLFELENAQLILDTHPQAVGQATIDQLLAQLALILSVSGTTRHPGTVPADLIFDRVCAIVGSLLSRFRRRLADRYHLFLPVLQQLVRCLFYSEEVVRRSRQPTVIGSDPSSYLRSIPSWLTSSSNTIPPSSAVNLSRLLSSICNPTVSAAKSSRRGGKSNELNDETKRVKAVASQHLQYLVMEYCRCSLDGDIAPGVREKLLPGMYAVLDAMSRDLMRAMNAAMDPSSRAIFKTLYDDWSRYGKWDKS